MIIQDDNTILEDMQLLNQFYINKKIVFLKNYDLARNISLNKYLNLNVRKKKVYYIYNSHIDYCYSINSKFIKKFKLYNLY
jgi:hypothetical protein